MSVEGKTETADAPGFHLGSCRFTLGDWPADPDSCAVDCPRRLHAEVRRLQEALERIVQLDDLGRPGTGEVARVALGGRFARAALDGEA